MTPARPVLHVGESCMYAGQLQPGQPWNLQLFSCAGDSVGARLRPSSPARRACDTASSTQSAQPAPAADCADCVDRIQWYMHVLQALGLRHAELRKRSSAICFLDTVLPDHEMS